MQRTGRHCLPRPCRICGGHSLQLAAVIRHLTKQFKKGWTYSVSLFEGSVDPGGGAGAGAGPQESEAVGHIVPTVRKWR